MDETISTQRSSSENEKLSILRLLSFENYQKHPMNLVCDDMESPQLAEAQIPLPLSPESETTFEPFESIDPTKCYWNRLPTELKRDIVDTIHHRDYYVVRDPSNVQFQIIEDVYQTLKNLRLVCSEMNILATPALFRHLHCDRLASDASELTEEELESRITFMAHHTQLLTMKVQPSPKALERWGLEDPDEEYNSMAWDVHRRRLQEYVNIMKRILLKIQGIRWLRLYVTGSPPMQELLNLIASQGNLLRISICFSFWPSNNQFETLTQSVLSPHIERLTGIYLSFEKFVSDAEVAARIFLFIVTRARSLQRLQYRQCYDNGLREVISDETVQWVCQHTIRVIHFEGCTDIDADVVPILYRRFTNLDVMTISSCGAYATYGDAVRKGDIGEYIESRLVDLNNPLRKPLSVLRIVHATDLELRQMSRIPTEELIINDPLDQSLLAPLLTREKTFPGLRRFLLEFLVEESDETDESDGVWKKQISMACEQRGVLYRFTNEDRDSGSDWNWNIDR